LLARTAALIKKDFDNLSPFSTSPFRSPPALDYVKTTFPVHLLLELGAGAGVPEPELRHILPEPELENSGKNSGRQNYEKLFHISTNIWH
jgi:hypothetical protein